MRWTVSSSSSTSIDVSPTRSVANETVSTWAGRGDPAASAAASRSIGATGSTEGGAAYHRAVRSLLSLGLPLVALAGLGACRDAPTRASGGFWFPDEGRVIDLTRPAAAPGDPHATTITTALEPGGATVDRLEPGRCLAPILVLDVRARALQAPDFAFASEDLLEQERRWGEIPAGSLVVLLTGGAQRDLTGPAAGAARPVHPGFSSAVVEMLARQRGVVGFGTDAPALDAARAN